MNTGGTETEEGGKAYDVLDWGELKNLKIKKMASHSAKS